MEKSIILCLISILLITASFFPAELKANAEKGQIQVITDVINVREAPDLASPIVTEVSYGEIYQITAERSNWIQITLEGGKKGWVAGWLISRIRQKENSNSELTPLAHAVVSADTLRIRNGPGKQFQIIGSLTGGKEAAILEKNENWVKINTDEITGWAAAEFLTEKKEEKPKSKKSKEKKQDSVHKIAEVTADGLNIRETPAMDGRVIGKVTRGTSLPFLKENGDWIKIEYQESTGWINKDFVNISPSSSTDKSRVPESKSGTLATITAQSLYIRETPSLNGKVAGRVTKNKTFTILEERNSWVKIEFLEGKTGWAASWFLEKTSNKEQKPAQKDIKGSKIKILYNGTNLREKADANSTIMRRAKEGEIFTAASIQNNWYQLQLGKGKTAFVAGWMVSVNGSGPQIQKPGAEKHLKNKVIIIDPGHGGRDNGTTGTQGNLEKNITLRTALLLYDKLKAAGANAILTRNTDTYISLESRVRLSHQYNADAFLSIHYDGSAENNASGITTYYLHGYQESLAKELHHSLSGLVKLTDRGTRQGDYHVLRENKRSAALLELGYLSNPAEEQTIVSGKYQEEAAAALYNGLAYYFNE
ncbi:N-acetylmuramoyl-L-alanine amidase [Peribacillus deserti]|uniref:N-acetylmuramoyl-L-alanine amidase n=1 Tax=Peribacillus deserti TaxID=673318 RepID=A0ABS2QFG0_9BACI|nr:SH3 domain-containing protein [Peribacillus deserti]MBM7691882.1 N-acetylmuramoyl-L-alanine amidase [Peribacillus deserti]